MLLEEAKKRKGEESRLRKEKEDIEESELSSEERRQMIWEQENSLEVVRAMEVERGGVQRKRFYL